MSSKVVSSSINRILDTNGLSKFISELAYIWAERGYTGESSSAHLTNSRTGNLLSRTPKRLIRALLSMNAAMPVFATA